MILGLIPARGGSKGIPRKNIRPLGGKPLIQWTVEAAFKADCFDRVILSTEDEEIAAVGRACGLDVPFLRPSGLARDNTPMSAVVWHVIGEMEPDIITILQPTTPFRDVTMLRMAVKCVDFGEYASAVSVIDVPKKYSPELAWDKSQFAKPPQGPTTRQAQRSYYVRDGSFYVFRTVDFVVEGTFFPPRCCPMRVEQTPNLDEESDWAEAERRLLVTA